MKEVYALLGFIALAIATDVVVLAVWTFRAL